MDYHEIYCAGTFTCFKSLAIPYTLIMNFSFFLLMRNKSIFPLQWYLQCRLPNRTFFLKPWLQCMICLWVVICSLTRIGDNRHHWWDVLAGNILGLAFSVLTVIMSCRKFHLNQNVSQIYNESIENEQINYNNKRKQSVKKLLHETPVDVSESRELKNVKSSTWKE